MYGYDDPIVQISKNLSYLLRHGAVEQGLKIDKEIHKHAFQKLKLYNNLAKVYALFYGNHHRTRN